jgi:hypothetical protein
MRDLQLGEQLLYGYLAHDIFLSALNVIEYAAKRLS